MCRSGKGQLPQQRYACQWDWSAPREMMVLRSSTHVQEILCTYETSYFFQLCQIIIYNQWPVNMHKSGHVTGMVMALSLCAL